MQPKQPLLQKCLHHLEALPHFQAKVEVMPYVTKSVLADGQLILHAPEREVEYIFEIKSDVTNETIGTISNYINHLRQKLEPQQRSLLITPQLSDRVVDQLIEAGIEFIDAKGNLYLNSPGNYVLVRSSARLDRSSSSAEITVNALQVIYGLLQAPEVLQSDNFDREIMTASGVSLAIVRQTLLKLDKLNYLERRKDRYEIVDYVKLLERWEMGYVESLRPKLFIESFTPVGNRSWSDVVDEILQKAKDNSFLIGGELGAAIVTDYLRPTHATLHVPEDYRRIFVNLKLKPSPQGEITFLRQFSDRTAWNAQAISSLVDPLLIHAELQMSPDSRLRETAKRLFDEQIAPRMTHA